MCDIVFKSVKDFYNFDMININRKTINHIVNTFKNSDKELRFLGVYNKCVIKDLEFSKNAINYIYFEELQDKEVLLKSYYYNTRTKKISHLFDLYIDYKCLNDNRMKVKYNILFQKKYFKQYREALVAQTEALCMSIFAYILELPKNTKPIIKNASSNTNQKNSNPISQKKSNKEKRSIIKIGELNINIVSENSSILKHFKKAHNKYTESWTVRGHLRKLKDGRIIHVKPYIKGNKDKFKAKDYNIKTS